MIVHQGSACHQFIQLMPPANWKERFHRTSNTKSKGNCSYSGVLMVWEADANWMKQQPGYLSTQLQQGIPESTGFMNDAVWESVAQFTTALNHPDFKNPLEH